MNLLLSICVIQYNNRLSILPSDFTELGASMVFKSLKKDRLKDMEIFDWELHDENRIKISQMGM